MKEARLRKNIDGKFDTKIVKRQRYIWAYNWTRKSYHPLNTSKDYYLPDLIAAASTNSHLFGTAKTRYIWANSNSQAQTSEIDPKTANLVSQTFESRWCPLGFRLKRLRRRWSEIRRKLRQSLATPLHYPQSVTARQRLSWVADCKSRIAVVLYSIHMWWYVKSRVLGVCKVFIITFLLLH